MAIVGLRDVGDFTVSGQRPKNWREGILHLYPSGKTGNAPLTALTALMKDRAVDDPEFNWYTRTLSPRRFALGANLTLSNTEVTLAAASAPDTRGALELKAGDILRVENTEELVRVTADPTSATALSVQRGFAGSTAATVDYDGAGVNPNLLVIGNAYEEGSLSPQGVQLDPTKRYNYTQIFRNSLEFTRTAMKTRLRTGDQVKQAKMDALEMQSMDMERAFFFGKRWEGTENGKPIRTMQGLYQEMTALASNNIDTAGSTTDMETLEGYLETAFKWGSEEKIAFVGNRALMVINQIIRRNSSYEIMSGVKEYGMNVSRLVTPFGELVLKRHPLFNNNPGGTTTAVAYTGMESWMWVIDQANLTYVYLKDSDIKYNPDIQANDLDGMKSEYLGEVSLEIHHPETFYLLKGLTAAAADT